MSEERCCVVLLSRTCAELFDLGHAHDSSDEGLTVHRSGVDGKHDNNITMRAVDGSSQNFCVLAVPWR